MPDSLLPEADFPLIVRALSNAIDAVKEVWCAAGAADAEGLCEKLRRRLESKKFRITVCALMKSGKSTLLSCLVRAPLFPEDLLPATATICDTTHNPDPSSGPSLQVNDGPPITGAQAIFDAITQANDEARANHGAAKLNMCVHLPLLSRVPSASVAFVFADTPGYNEAGSAVVRAVSNEQLKEADVILYVFDISKIGSEDEESYVAQLVRERSDLVRDGRLVLAMNKMDLVPEDEREAKFQEAKAFVVRCAGRVDPALCAFIEQAAIFVPTISNDFLLPTCALGGNLPSAYVGKLKKMVGGPRSDRVDLSSDRVRECLLRMAARSGVPELETAIAEKLCAAPTLFFQSVVGQLLRFVEMAHQRVAADIAAGALDAANLARLIDVFQGAMDTVEANTHVLSGRLDQEEQRCAQAIDDHMSQLRTDRCTSLPTALGQTREYASHAEAREAAKQLVAVGYQALGKDRMARRAQCWYEVTQHISLVFADLCQQGRTESMQTLLGALHEDFPDIADDVRAAFPDATRPALSTEPFEDGCVSEAHLQEVVEACQSKIEREVTEKVGRVVQPEYRTSDEASSDADLDGIGQGIRFLATVGVVMPLRTVHKKTKIQLVTPGGVEYDDVKVNRDVFVVDGPAIAERLVGLHYTLVDDLAARLIALRTEAFALARSNLSSAVLRPLQTIMEQLRRSAAERDSSLRDASRAVESKMELLQRVARLTEVLHQEPPAALAWFAAQ